MIRSGGQVLVDQLALHGVELAFCVPGESGTSLTNPDFAAFAQSFGAFGEVVERTEEFAPALERALAAGGPALLELRVDPEGITPSATLTEPRQGRVAAERTETA